MLTNLRSYRSEIIEMARARGASRVRVFGSVGRGDATETSGVDFLVDLDEGRGLCDLGGLLMDLQDFLGCNVDVVTEAGLRSRVTAKVMRDAVIATINSSTVDSVAVGSVPAYAVPIQVLGVMSPRGYINHPVAKFCNRAGVKIGASETRTFTRGERPALGVFTMDDGSTYSVQWNTVIGRSGHVDRRASRNLPPTRVDRACGMGRADHRCRHAERYVSEEGWERPAQAARSR